MLSTGPKFIALLILYTFLSTLGLFKIKQSDLALGFDFLFGFAFYVAGFALWMYMLKIFDLSIAFPIAAGALIIATQFVSYVLLEEAASLAKLSGSVLIVAGIFLIYFESWQ